MVVSLAEGAGAAPGFLLGRLAGDVVFLAVVGTLIPLNRRGYTTLACWILCAALVLNGSGFFSLSELDRVLVLSVSPILVAAFLIGPNAAFQFLALGVADYLLACARHGGGVPLNWLSLLTLAGITVAIWLVARRAAWFEEAEEMSRLELDRAVLERDELDLSVQTLHAELDAERSAGAQARASLTAR